MRNSHHAAYHDGILDCNGALEQSLHSPESSMSRSGLLETSKLRKSGRNTFMAMTCRRILTIDSKRSGRLIASKVQRGFYTYKLMRQGPEYKAE